MILDLIILTTRNTLDIESNRTIIARNALYCESTSHLITDSYLSSRNTKLLPISKRSFMRWSSFSNLQNCVHRDMYSQNLAWIGYLVNYTSDSSYVVLFLYCSYSFFRVCENRDINGRASGAWNNDLRAF